MFLYINLFSKEFTIIIPPFPGVDNALFERQTPSETKTQFLASLAPDIIEAILRGDEPDGLSLEKLRKPALSEAEGPALSEAEGNLPVRWDEQRKRRE